MFVAIAGNIGSGKTTLTRMLAQHYGWEPRFEPVITNPYLEDYYADIKRWCFNLEVYFLKERFNNNLELGNSQKTIIQDRTLFEGVHIFMENNRTMGNISERDYETYMELFQLMMNFLNVPDLMIYLKSSVPHIVGQIQKRGRDYEQGIQMDYLKGLNDKYEDFIQNKYPGKVLTVEVDNLDFEHNVQDFASITDRIDAQLFGLFPNE